MELKTKEHKNKMMNYSNPNDPWQYEPYNGMSDDERKKIGCAQVIGIVVGVIIALLLCALLGGCTTTKYVPVYHHTTDTLRITQHHRDSIYLSDSIYISDFVRTDTVFRTVERWHTQFRDRWRHDTIYQARHDTVPQPYPVTEYIEKPLSKFDWLLRIMGTVAIVLIMMRIAKVLRNTLP